jgi:protein-S-isoprenylcysteine O-methyltransferase Ste14
MITLAVATANWLVPLPMIARSVLIYAQVGMEEAILIDRFGDEHRQYTKQTPRFLPKLPITRCARVLPTDTNEK